MRPLEPDPQGLLSLKATAKHSSHFKERAGKKAFVELEPWTGP